MTLFPIIYIIVSLRRKPYKKNITHTINYCKDLIKDNSKNNNLLIIKHIVLLATPFYEHSIMINTPLVSIIVSLKIINLRKLNSFYIQLTSK
jgi:hypothetical protein